MRRRKVPHSHTQPQLLPDNMTPWEITEELKQIDAPMIQIPTYRKDIVDKFLSNVKNQDKKASIKRKLSQRKDQQVYRNPLRLSKVENSNVSKKSHTEGSRGSSGGSMNDYELIIEEVERKKKAKICTKIVDINKIFQSFRSHSEKFQQSGLSPPKSSMTKNLKLRAELRGKDLKPTITRKQKSKTLTNIFHNPFFLYQFGEVDTSIHNVYRPITANSYSRSSLVRRATSNSHYQR